MTVNEYMEIMRDSNIKTDGFEVDISSNDKEHKILKLGSRLQIAESTDGFQCRRYFSAEDYFKNGWSRNWIGVEIHFSLNKYIIRDILTSGI